MKKCDCYHEEKKKEKYSDLVRGIILAKTGRLPKEDYHEVIKATCWGTPECETCYCGGDRTKCDFYPENRTKALEAKKKGRVNKMLSPAHTLLKDGSEDEIRQRIADAIRENASPDDAAQIIYNMFLTKEQ